MGWGGTGVLNYCPRLSYNYLVCLFFSFRFFPPGLMNMVADLVGAYQVGKLESVRWEIREKQQETQGQNVLPEAQGRQMETDLHVFVVPG